MDYQVGDTVLVVPGAINDQLIGYFGTITDAGKGMFYACLEGKLPEAKQTDDAERLIRNKQPYGFLPKSITHYPKDNRTAVRLLKRD